LIAKYSYQLETDSLVGGKPIYPPLFAEFITTTCPDSVSALLPAHTAWFVGIYATENRTVACTFTCSFMAFELRSEYPIFDVFHGGYALLGELTDIPTDALIDLLFVILAGEVTLTANDVAEIEEIQRELQRRGEEYSWSSRTVN